VTNLDRFDDNNTITTTIGV